jgi:hypothetical protein
MQFPMAKAKPLVPKAKTAMQKNEMTARTGVPRRSSTLSLGSDMGIIVDLTRCWRRRRGGKKQMKCLELTVGLERATH